MFYGPNNSDAFCAYECRLPKGAWSRLAAMMLSILYLSDVVAWPTGARSKWTGLRQFHLQSFANASRCSSQGFERYVMFIRI